MADFELFLPLQKVDLDRRLVHGMVTAEEPDRSGEICDYETTKPYFEAWSRHASDVTGGKSLGAVRAMHGLVAAGKVTDISYDDDNKRIFVAAKIVDDAEWEKVVEGLYTGFSQGGKYIRKWADADSNLTRYTADPTEISLVDLPCLPGATFDVVKNGAIHKRAFAGATMKPPLDASAASAASVVAKGDDPRAKAISKAARALRAAARKLSRTIDETPSVAAALDEMRPALAALAKRIEVLEAQPLPSRAALKAVPRASDVGERAASESVDAALNRLAALTPEERALALTKLSLGAPTFHRL